MDELKDHMNFAHGERAKDQIKRYEAITEYDEDTEDDLDAQIEIINNS